MSTFSWLTGDAIQVMVKLTSSSYTHVMFVFWLLWIIVVFGGLYMGLGSMLTMIDSGFDVALMLNFIIYTGCALYGMPRLFRLIVRKG